MNNKLIELSKRLTCYSSSEEGAGHEAANLLNNVLYDIQASDSPKEANIKTSTLSSLLHNHESKSALLLANLLIHLLQVIPNLKQLKQNSPDEHLNINLDETQFISDIQHNLAKYQKGEISIRDVTMPETKLSKPIFYRQLIELLNFWNTDLHKINEDEFTSTIGSNMMLLGFALQLAKHFKRPHEFFLVFMPFIQKVSRLGYFQPARDYSEESFIIAFENQMQPYGYLTKFKILADQKNVIDALINGIVVLLCTIEEGSIQKDLKKEVLFTSFLTFRNARIFPLASKVHEIIKQIVPLTPYELRQQEHAHFALKLTEGDTKVGISVADYLQKRHSCIVDSGETESIPWFGLLCNIKCYYPEQYRAKNTLAYFYSLMRENISEEVATDLETRILPGQPLIKERLKEQLILSSSTRNSQDLKQEIATFSLTTNNCIEQSIKTNDFEGILLGHYINSDSFRADLSQIKSSSGNVNIGVNYNKKSVEKYLDYLSYLKSILKKKCQYVWLGEINGRIYTLSYDNSSFGNLTDESSITFQAVNKWLDEKLPKFEFRSNPNQITATNREIWENESYQLRESLLRLSINITQDELILFTDQKMAKYPHNLIRDHSGELISEIVPISNPLSLDNVPEFDNQCINLKMINYWSPTESKDFVIEMANEKLKGCSSKYSFSISNSNYPKFDNPEGLNILLVHGGLDPVFGFNGFFSGNKQYSDNQLILGSGKVAILFVCHGGNINENLFSVSNNSIMKTALQAGYQSVIAPRWALNIDLVEPWCSSFLSYFSSGNSLSYSVFFANKDLKKQFPTESAWAIMHLYGNPFITAKQ